MVTSETNDNSKETFGDSIMGTHSAIKQFVEAQKEDQANSVDKGKKDVLKKALKKAK